METLLNAALSNAVVVVPLAILAALLGRLGRRPALAHALWVVVLLKLVTPPLVSIPVPWRFVPEVASEPEEVVAGDALEALPQPEPATAAEMPPAVADDAEIAEADPVPAVEGEATVSDTVEPVLPRVSAEASTAIPWSQVLAGGWLAAALGWFFLAWVRLWRFQRLLRWAQPVPGEVVARVQTLASSMGLMRIPQVQFVPGTLAPLLWAVGRPARLIIPAPLWERLHTEQRDALLVHELAHWKRHDHWVRWLEFLTTGLYWWHPVVWWARRELREAEEHCCDAWVVWALPDAARAYAAALVETVDFLSTSPPSMPALASGMGHISDLRRRVTMILRGTTPRALTWGGFLGVLGLAAVLLPLTPSWGQTPTGDRERQEAERARRAAQQERLEAEQDRKRNEEKGRGERGPQDRERLERTQAEVRELEAQVQRMRGELERATRRLEELRGATGGPDRPGTPRPGLGGIPGAPGTVPGGPPIGGTFTPAFGGGRRGPGEGNTEQRLQAIEQKLESIMRVMETMQNERRQGGPVQPPFGRGAGGDRPANAPRAVPPGREGERGLQPTRAADAPRQPLYPVGGQDRRPDGPPRATTPPREGERRPDPRPDQPRPPMPRGEVPGDR